MKGLRVAKPLARGHLKDIHDKKDSSHHGKEQIHEHVGQLCKDKTYCTVYKLQPTASKNHSHASFGHWRTWAKVTGTHTRLGWSDTLWTKQEDVIVLNPPFGKQKMYALLENRALHGAWEWLPELSISVETMLQLSKL